MVFQNARKFSLLLPASILLLLIGVFLFYKKSANENLVIIEITDQISSSPKVKGKWITADKSRKPQLYDLIFFSLVNREGAVENKFVGTVEDINDEGCFWVMVSERETGDWLCKNDFSSLFVVIDIDEADPSLD